jgi:hypothetical protein
MLRLDQNFKNTDVGRPFVKMSVNWEVIGTCRAWTSPMAMRSRTKWSVDLDMLHTLMLNGIDGEVDGADVVIVDESAL